MDRHSNSLLAPAGAGAAAVAGFVAFAAWRDGKLREIVDDKPVSFQKFDPRRITADPEAFQFKDGGDAAGVTERLRGVTKWDPVAAGKAVVFERADGKLVIADGHQRLGLAKRVSAAGESVRMDGYLFRERDGWSPKDVRAYAALKNIKELSGAALDMAKVMRERPNLVDGSVPMSDAKIKEAMSLSKLSPKAFNMVVGGVIRPELAAAIGDVKDSARHASLLGEMVKADVGTIQQARLYVGQALAAPTIAETNLSLFGEETETRSLVKERTAVLDKALSVLKSDRKVFATLEREASRIEDAGNKLARASNAARAESAGQLNALVEKLATRHGPVSSMLDDAARAVASGEQPGAAARKFVEGLTDRARSAGGLNALVTDAPIAPRPTPESQPVAKGQASFLPEATTQEKVAAQAKAMDAKGRVGDPMNGGLFSSWRQQVDLEDAIKSKGPAGWSDAAREASAEARADASQEKLVMAKGNDLASRLKGLKKAQLQAVAKQISAPAGSKLTVAQLRDGIQKRVTEQARFAAKNSVAAQVGFHNRIGSDVDQAKVDAAGARGRADMNAKVNAAIDKAAGTSSAAKKTRAKASTSRSAKVPAESPEQKFKLLNNSPENRAAILESTERVLKERGAWSPGHEAEKQRAEIKAKGQASVTEKVGGKLGLAAIATAALLAYDATKQQAEAAGASTTDARMEGGKAAAAAGGIAAGVTLGITKAIQSAGPVIGGIVAKAMVPGTVAVAAATDGRKGYEKGGITGAAVETGKGTMNYLSGGLIPHLNTKARETLLPNDGRDRAYHAPRSSVAGKTYLNAAAARKAEAKPVAGGGRRGATAAQPRSSNGMVQEYTRRDGTRVQSYKRAAL